MAPHYHRRVRLVRQNPGWQGPGVLPLATRCMRALRAAAGQLRRREWSALGNLLLAESANVWNLHVPLRRGRSLVECPCCAWRGPAFLASANWRAVSRDSRCPRCDSRSRHRGLYAMLPRLVSRKPPGATLLFAPELVTLALLRRLMPDGPIHTTDLQSVDVDLPGQDIQALRLDSGTYAFLVCNHVLEHVEDDLAAIGECRRVLRPGGIALFTVPGDFPRRRTRVFATPDPNGHLRHYGMDVLEKFQAAFLSVEAWDMSEGAPAAWRVRRHDYAFICVAG